MAHSTRLEPPAGRDLRKFGRDIRGCRRDLRSMDDRAASGYNANVRLCHRDIQAGEYSTGWSLPMMKPIRFGFREEPPTITRC